MWTVLGDPEMTPALKQRIVDGVLDEAGGRSVDELAAQRDAMLLALQAVRASHDRAGLAVASPHG
jgi:carnitine 3-dehydrogenase